MSTDSDWIQTYTGRAFFPLRPLLADIDLIDIAHGLSQLCRYGGQCRAFYSVAEHSVLLSEAVPAELAPWALLHDASEAYLVDIPRPIKHLLPDYQAAEHALQAMIYQRFGLGAEPEALKAYDVRMLHTEQAALHPRPPRPWNIPGKPLPGITISGWLPLAAKARFLARADALRIRAVEKEA